MKRADAVLFFLLMIVSSLATSTREAPVASVPYHDMPIQREYRGYVMGYTCVTKLPRVTKAIYTYVV